MPAGRFNPNIYPGARFGRLTVLERIPRNGSQRSKIRCRCDCGTITTPNADNFKNGNTQSCGCLNLEKIKERVREQSRNSKRGQLLPGKRVGKLTIVKRIEDGDKLTPFVECLCDCGKTTNTTLDAIISGNTRSCGCLISETVAARNKATGSRQCFTSEQRPTWQSWQAMIIRCCNEKATSYRHYGARGVKPCQFLAEAPQNLVAVIGYRKEGTTLDRYPIFNGNYTCGQCDECKQNGWEKNVRWATRREQNLNKGSYNVFLTAFGKTLSKSQWMDLSGIGWQCLTGRLRRGWEIERALTTPDTFGNCYRPAAEVPQVQ